MESKKPSCIKLRRVGTRTRRCGGTRTTPSRKKKIRKEVIKELVKKAKRHLQRQLPGTNNEHKK